MNIPDIVTQRLYNQQIAAKKFNKPGDVVTWLGAVQAQDYASTKHAIGLRLSNITDVEIEKAINDKTIVRTWALRGTLHIMAAKDTGWILDLLAPGIIARTKSRFKQLELNETTLLKTNQLLLKSMEGGKQLTREKIFEMLEQHGISTNEQRGLHILYKASLDKIICHGSMQDKQFTHTLFDEWIPEVKTLKREEALFELAKRYFTSHGPATLQDFIWWSGISVTNAKTALEQVKPHLIAEIIDTKTYWMSSEATNTKNNSIHSYLLPAFDEYIIGYTDRSLIINQMHSKHVISKNGIFFPTIIVDGQVIGIWKRTFKKGIVLIETQLFNSLNTVQKNAITEATDDYGKFVGMPVSVKL